MYYEFYIDQFFLEHFLTGCLLLYVLDLIQRGQLSWKRILAGAFVSAVTMTILICAGFPGWYFTGILAAASAAFGGKDWKKFGSSFLLLFFVTICFGGAMEILLGLWKLPMMAGVTITVFTMRWFIRWVRAQQPQKDGIVTVKIQWEDRTKTIRAMIDTGNQLKEPLTGKPVSIVEETFLEPLLGSGWESRRGFYLIPYHSIGTDQGWLRGVTVDRMDVKTLGKTVTINHPVLAIYQGQVSGGGQYQMILHPHHTAVS